MTAACVAFAVVVFAVHDDVGRAAEADQTLWVAKAAATFTTLVQVHASGHRRRLLVRSLAASGGSSEEHAIVRRRRTVGVVLPGPSLALSREEVPGAIRFDNAMIARQKLAVLEPLQLFIDFDKMTCLLLLLARGLLGRDSATFRITRAARRVVVRLLRNVGNAARHEQLLWGRLLVAVAAQ